MKKSTVAQAYSIRRFMTRAPHVVTPDTRIAHALRLMGELDVRHLPVVERNGQEKLVGLVSERDLVMLEAVADVQPDRTPVSSAMQTDVYGVAADTPIDEVVATMAAHKYGSAVVLSGGAVVGIFTSVDAMRILAETIRKDRGESPGHGAQRAVR